MLNLNVEPPFNVVDGQSVGDCHLVKLRLSEGRSGFGFTFETGRVVMFDGSVHHADGVLLDFGTDFRIAVALDEIAILDAVDRAQPGDLIALGKDELYLVTKGLSLDGESAYVNLQKGTAHLVVNGA